MTGEAGTVIALAVRRTRRSIVGHFCALHALSAPDAVEYVPRRPIETRQFARMRERGVIHEARPGFYWIDLVALKADEDARRNRLVPLVIALAVLAAVALTFLYRG
ncbi:MAG: hypothetical protein WDN24_01230 [Sphingomonas sp.]